MKPRQLHSRQPGTADIRHRLEYDQILHPQREGDAEVRKRLQRLTTWSKTVPYQFNPLLLRMHADYRRGALSAKDVSRLLRYGRFAVAGVLSGAISPVAWMKPSVPTGHGTPSG